MQYPGQRRVNLCNILDSAESMLSRSQIVERNQDSAEPGWFPKGTVLVLFLRSVLCICTALNVNTFITGKKSYSTLLNITMFANSQSISVSTYCSRGKSKYNV